MRGANVVGEPNRRGHFRLRYPAGTGPMLVIGAAAFRVVELSERGLQFTGGARALLLGERLSGALRFEDGSEMPVEGAVVRIVGPRTVLRLVRGVALGRMIAEQRRILRDYPNFLRTGSEDRDPTAV
jgi:hypothetical protein